MKIPTPKFVVFYNGTAKQPERQILRLSDSFSKQTLYSLMHKHILSIEDVAKELNISVEEFAEMLNSSGMFVET